MIRKGWGLGMKTRSPVLAFWSLNDDLQAEELLMQMEQMKQEGITGFFLHARAGLKVPYMSETWLSLLETVVRAAERMGLQAWLYDENGWPSGMADGKVPEAGRDFCQKILRHVRLAAGEPLPGDCLGVFGPDGGLPQEDGERLAFYLEYNENYSDILYPPAVERFIRLTHERYKERLGAYFGSVIPGIFTDEPQLAFRQHPWSTGLEQVFEETYGYGLLERLPLLVLDGEGSAALRHDFWKLISRRYTTVYIQAFYNWCQDNRLLFTGHLSNEDSPLWQLSAVGSVMPNYRYFQIPGIDHLGNRITSPVLMKQLSSVARQFDKPDTLCECFGCAGWNVGFQELLWMWGRLALHGVNIPCLHLFAYSMKGCRKRDYPAFFSPQEPWWEKLHHLVEGMEKVSGFFAGAWEEVEILVLHPQSSFWCMGEPNGNERMAAMSNAFRLLTENLLSLGYGFDYGDEWLLETDGRVENGRLWLGGCAYRLVVVPPALSLEASTVALLDRFMEAGGRVLFIDGLPSLTEGRPGMAIDWRQMENVSFCGNRRNLLERQCDLRACAAPVRLLDDRGGENPEGLCRALLSAGEEQRLFVWNTSRTTGQEIRLACDEPCTILDEEGAPVAMEEDGCLSAPLRLEGMSMRMLTLRRGAAPSVFQPRPWKRSEAVRPEARWQVRFDQPNALTLDKASWRVEGEEFGEEMPLPDLQRAVFERACRAEEPLVITVRYAFWLAGSPMPLTLAAETADASTVSVNGHSVYFADWLLDKSLHTAALSPDCLRAGENVVEIAYRLGSYRGRLRTDDVFESIRNKFAFPVEIESVYLLGDFSLIHEGVCRRLPRIVQIDAPRFILAPPVNGTLEGGSLDDCLGRFGRWFYRGSLLLDNVVSLKEGARKTVVKLNRLLGAGATVVLNGGTPHVLTGSGEADVTADVHAGENALHIEVWGSNRNLLGPHHHVAGEGCLIGPSMWEGRRGWEDAFTPGNDPITRIAAYNFVPLGLGEEPCVVQLW